MALTCKTSLSNLQVGDYVWCKYTATSGACGTFSDLATKTDAQVSSLEIPVVSTATPDGYFRFIKTGKGLLIADRVVQHTISWDVLRTGGFIEGKFINNSMIVLSTDISKVSGTGFDLSRPVTRAFDKSNGTVDYSTGCAWTNGFPARAIYDLVTPDIVTKYSIMTLNRDLSYSPTAWTLEASNDGVNWTVLHTPLTQTGWTASEKRYFNVSNTTAYRYYSIKFTSAGDSAFAIIDEIEFIKLNPQAILYIIRSLSGGVNFVDANGNLSATDKSLGAFPNINEWDKYIVNSNLDGNITMADDAVWHWSNKYTYSKDVMSSESTYRMLRGYTTAKTATSGALVSSSTSANAGFRPVLQYVESDGSSKQTNLWY